MNNTTNRKVRPIKLTYIFAPNSLTFREVKEIVFYNNKEYDDAIRLTEEQPDRYQFVKMEFLPIQNVL